MKKNYNSLSLSKGILTYWYSLTILFLLKFELTTSGLKTCLKALGFEQAFNINLPRFWCPDYATADIDFSISENKSLEIGYFYDFTRLLCFIFNSTMHTEHPTHNVDIGILGFNFYIKLYDNREWDYSKNKLKEYE